MAAEEEGGQRLRQCHRGFHEAWALRARGDNEGRACNGGASKAACRRPAGPHLQSQAPAPRRPALGRGAREGRAPHPQNAAGSEDLRPRAALGFTARCGRQLWERRERAQHVMSGGGLPGKKQEAQGGILHTACEKASAPFHPPRHPPVACQSHARAVAFHPGSPPLTTWFLLLGHVRPAGSYIGDSRKRPRRQREVVEIAGDADQRQ